MTRAIIATATALIAASTLMSSAAQACLSCEYVPEVVREHATSPMAYGRGDNNAGHEAHITYSSKARFSSRDEEAPRSKKIAKSEDEPKSKKIAKIDRSEKSEKVAKISKSEKSEPVKVAKVEPDKKASTKAADSESSSITVASVSETKSAAVVTKPKTPDVNEASAKPTDCKKFFASVGMTLTVPCE